MRIRPPHTAGRAVCEGMVHMIFSGSSKGAHTVHNVFVFFKLTYIQFTPLVAYVFVFSIIIFLCVCVYLLL